jgi:hypothetical protein
MLMASYCYIILYLVDLIDWLNWILVGDDFVLLKGLAFLGNPDNSHYITN